MSDQQLDEIAQLKAAAKEATKPIKASKGALRKTSVLAASVMYWLSFGPGKLITNTVSGSLVAAGFPMAATYAPWVNAMGVPFIQVAFAEPFGGAYRGDGQSYQSPDGAAYANYQTALALMCRAWLEGNQDDIDKYNAILGKIVDSVIDREKKAQEAGKKPMYWTSGKDKPERDEKGLIKDPGNDPAFWVMWYARWRSFLSDEIPIHTFSILNGFSGAASMAWPKLMGPALARIPDAGAHVILGTLAMISMFEGQNIWRRDLQNASLAHGADKEVLALKRAAPHRQLEIWTQRMTQLAGYNKEIDALRSSLSDLTRTLPEGDKRLDSIAACLGELDGVQRELHLRMETVYQFNEKAKHEADAWKSVKDRAEATAKGTMNAYLGEPNKQPVPWLDGSPLAVRNVAKLFGYMAALAPSAIQAMMLAQMLLVPNTPGANHTAPQPSGWNDTLVPGNTTLTGGTHEVTTLEWVMASTVALNAIVGWTGRTLYCVPAFEFLIHGTIGAAKGAAKKAASCVRATRGEPVGDVLLVLGVHLRAREDPNVLGKRGPAARWGRCEVSGKLVLVVFVSAGVGSGNVHDITSNMGFGAGADGGRLQAIGEPLIVELAFEDGLSPLVDLCRKAFEHGGQRFARGCLGHGRVHHEQQPVGGHVQCEQRIHLAHPEGLQHQQRLVRFQAAVWRRATHLKHQVNATRVRLAVQDFHVHAIDVGGEAGTQRAGVFQGQAFAGVQADLLKLFGVHGEALGWEKTLGGERPSARPLPGVVMRHENVRSIHVKAWLWGR